MNECHAVFFECTKLLQNVQKSKWSTSEVKCFSHRQKINLFLLTTTMQCARKQWSFLQRRKVKLRIVHTIYVARKLNILKPIKYWHIRNHEQQLKEVIKSYVMFSQMQPSQINTILQTFKSLEYAPVESQSCQTQTSKFLSCFQTTLIQFEERFAVKHLYSNTSS